MDALQTQIQTELNIIITLLEKKFGLKSRWTGTAYLTKDVTARGRMNWSCDISIDFGLAQTGLRWRTLIHEALHTLSAGLKPTSYAEARGWRKALSSNCSGFYDQKCSFF